MVGRQLAFSPLGPGPRSFLQAYAGDGSDILHQHSLDRDPSHPNGKRGSTTLYSLDPHVLTSNHVFTLPLHCITNRPNCDLVLSFD